MFAALALSLAAHAGPYAEELAAMEETVAALQAMDLSGDPKGVTRAVEKGVRDLKQLQEQAAAAQSLGSAAHKARVYLRLAEGHVAFDRALLDAPCPTGLEGEPCAVYQGLLAEKVVAFLAPAEKLSERIREQVIVGTVGSDKLKGKEVKRAKALRGEIAALAERARAAAPPPRAGVGAKWPDPVPFGVPAPLPVGVVVEPAGGAARAPSPDAWFVQIDPTAVMTADRSGSGARLRVSTVAPTADAPAATLARLLAEEGDRVQVELGGGSGRLHSHADAPWDDAWRVRMWVDRAALLPVTTAPVTRAFPDGSGATLRPGAVIVDNMLWVDDLRIPLDVPAGALGDRYQEAPEATFPDADGAYVQRDATLSLGGAAAFALPASYGPDGARWADVLVQREEGGELVLLRSACGEVRLAVRGRDAAAGGTGGLGGVFGAVGTPEARFALAPGTPLLWPDGRPAGVVAAPRTLRGADFPIAEDGRRCITLDAGWLEERQADWDDRHVRVCVAPATE